MESTNEVKESQPLIQEMRKLTTASGNKYFALEREFLLYSEVYNPEIDSDLAKFNNTSFLKLATEEVAKKPQQESIDFLEVGCGAGHIAVSVALISDKCHVWATDIIETAVKNAEANAKLHGVENRFQVVQANVFDHEEITGKKFDMIYWNHPWTGQHTTAGTEIEPIMHGIMDPGYQGLRSYLSKGGEYLKESGRLIVGFSFSYGSQEKFTEIARETGWSFKVIDGAKCCVDIGGKTAEHVVNIIELIKEVK